MKGNTSVLVVALLVTSSIAVLFGSLSPQVKALTGGPDAYGYTFDDTAPYSWIPAAGVIVADDPTNCQNPAGANDFLFGNFNFYGVGYAGIIVCPNGFVKFTGALNTGTTSNSNLPNSAIPNADIVGLGTTAFDPTLLGSGKIYFDKQPTQTVVTWDNVNLSTMYQAQFQIVMKDTGVVDIQYSAIPLPYAGVTSGIESPLGDMGLQYSGSAPTTRLLNNTNVRYSPPAPLVADTLTITGEDHAPATAQQTAATVMERYTLTAGSGVMALTTFRIQKLGTVADANIWVRIYNDTNNNSILDTSIDQNIIGSTAPVAGIVTVTFSPPRLITPASTQRWLIIVDCQCKALPGDTFGVRVAAGIPSATVAGIDTVTYSPASPIDSGLTAVVAFPTSTLSLSFTDRAPATVLQGQTSAVMLDMNATVDVGSVRMTRMNVTLTGVPPRDADVLRAMLVADSNDDGQYESLIDRVLSTTTFTAGIASFFPWFTFYSGPANSVRMLIVIDVSGSALPGDTLGVGIRLSAEVMTDTCNAVISPVGFPGASGNALIVAGTPNTVTITSWTDHAPATAYQGDSNIVMANFTVAVDTGVARISNTGWLNITLTGVPPNSNDLQFGPMGQVVLWEDANADGQLTVGMDARLAGGWFAGGPPFTWIARITPFMGPVEITAGSPRDFLLTYGISTMATLGDTVGARIDNVTSARFDTLTAMSPINIPLQSTNTLIMASMPDTLSLSMNNLAPLTAAPFERGVVLGRILLDVPVGGGSNYVDMRGLNIRRTGTSSDSDVFAVGVYHDVNGDSSLDPTTDRFLGASRFSGGSAFINFDPMFGSASLRVKGGVAESLLLVVDISPTATLLATLGLEVTNPADVNIDTMAGDAVSPLGFPLDTGLLTIRGIPVIPSLASPWTTAPPTMDGSFSPAEWADAVRVDLREVMGNRLPAFLYAKNDGTNLYMAVDVVGDHTSDFADFAAIAFDTWNDGVGTDRAEDMFSAGGWSESFQNHRVYNSTLAGWDVEDAPFNQGMPSHTTLDLFRGFAQTPMEAIRHPVVEFQIPLALLRASPGDTLGFVAGAPSGPSSAGVSDSWGFGNTASWPLGFGPMIAPPVFDTYGDLVLGKPPPADLFVTGSDLAPSVVLRGQTNVLMLNLTMTASVPMAMLSALNITATGSGSDADVAAVKLYDDLNDNGLLDIGTDMLMGTRIFTGGYANFTGIMRLITMGTPERFLVVYDVAATATYGMTLGARLSGPSAVVLAGGGSVSGTFPIQSANSAINTPPTETGLAVDGYFAFTPAIMHIVTPPNDPAISWNYGDADGHGQNEYKVQVWTGPSGTGTLMWDPPAAIGPATSVPYGGAILLDGATYYARVNVSDSYEWSGWSEIEFLINTPPPTPGLPIGPSDGASLPASTAQTVSWSGAADAEGDAISYAWQVEENGTCTFITLMAGGAASANVSASFQTNISSSYCWRVEANDTWESSGWSSNWNFTTSLTVNSPPALGLPSVSPITGSGMTMFTYSARYTDTDNDAPGAGTPRLWIKKGGVPIAGSPFSMVPGAWVGAPNDYVTGRDYSYATTLPILGLDYTYYFVAEDAWGASNSTAESDAPDVINNAPVLDWVGSGNYSTDGLDPETGTRTTVFTFRVVYTDANNDSPASIELRIEKPVGTPWLALPMALSSWVGAPNDYAVGAIYAAPTTLSSSGLDYSYFFNASDGMEWASGAPANPIDAPDVDDPPVASATVWPGSTGFRGTIFVFDAANSTDDFGIVSWQWEFGDGLTSATQRASHMYASAGSFAVNLTVWDTAGQSDMETLTIAVANRLPTASATVAPASPGYVTTTFMFDGSTSSDSDGTIVSYDWSFGDGSSASSSVVTHSFSQKRTFTVSLVVTDSDGGTNQTTLTVQVLNRPPVIVTSTPSGTTASVQTGVKQTFAVDASDPDGDSLIYAWTVDGHAAGTTSPFFDFQSAEVGTHTVMVTVSDGIESVARSWTVGVVAAAVGGTDTFPWWLLIVVIAVIAIVGILLFIFLMKRKKTRNDGIVRGVPPPPPPPPPPPSLPPR